MLWITVERGSVDGRPCRDYGVHADGGAPLLSARAFNWGRDILVDAVDDPGRPCLLLRRRRSFPLTGKVDLLELPGHRRIGVLGRSGRFRDADGRPAGRFRDARSLRDHATESLITGVAEALLGGDGTQSDTRGPTGFVYLIGDEVAGTLARARLPFALQPPHPPSPGRAHRPEADPALALALALALSVQKYVAIENSRPA